MANNFVQYNNYLVKPADENEWVDFLLNAQNPNIFYHPLYIKYNGQKTQKLFIKNNEEVLASILLCISEDEKNIIRPKELLYTPIVYSKKIFLKKPKGTVNKELYSIIYNIYAYLTNNFNLIDITFDHHTRDIRPFVWHSFYKSNGKIDITPLFTAEIKLFEDINKNIEQSQLFKNYTRSKRWEYRKSLEENLYVSKNLTQNEFLKTFAETFKRQEIELKDTTINDKLFNVLDALQKLNLVKYVVIRNDKDNIENLNILSTVGKRASIIYSARSINNSTFSGSFLFTETFKILQKMGIEICDLEGINSPKRGFNKISYGGSINNYYHIKIDN